jgi:hypothetical protein
MHYTERLQSDRCPLTDSEREECQGIVDFCEKKLKESPAPRTFLGRILDSLSSAKELREIRQIQVEYNRRILDAECVEVLRCMPQAVIHIAQYEDEGYHYFFDVGEDIVLFFGGQDYRPTRAFPNTEFELVRLVGDSVFRMNRSGEKLAPIRTVPGKVAKNLPVYAGAIFTFRGKLDTAERDYQAHIESTDPAEILEWC